MFLLLSGPLQACMFLQNLLTPYSLPLSSSCHFRLLFVFPNAAGVDLWPGGAKGDWWREDWKDRGDAKRRNRGGQEATIWRLPLLSGGGMEEWKKESGREGTTVGVLISAASGHCVIPLILSPTLYHFLYPFAHPETNTLPNKRHHSKTKRQINI